QPPKKCRILRAGSVYRSENAESYAREPSTAQKLQNPARRKAPPLRNRRISRAATFHRSGIAQSHALGAVHRSEIAESHARQRSTAQELQNPARGDHPPRRNREISRAVPLHCSEITESYAR